MNNRIMIKLSASDGCIRLRTFSRENRSPHGFEFTEKEMKIYYGIRYPLLCKAGIEKNHGAGRYPGNLLYLAE